jgi:hypothetical protein
MSKISSVIILAIAISVIPFSWFETKIAIAQTDGEPTETIEEDRTTPTEPTETIEDSPTETETIETTPTDITPTDTIPSTIDNKPTTPTEPTDKIPSTIDDDRLDKSVEKVLTNLLNAIATNNYDNFVAEGNSGFKDAITKEMFDPVSKELATRLNEGYTTVFLDELKQQDYQVYVWKLTFKDGSDDFLIRLSLKDGKVGGFWLN